MPLDQIRAAVHQVQPKLNKKNKEEEAVLAQGYDIFTGEVTAFLEERLPKGNIPVKDN